MTSFVEQAVVLKGDSACIIGSSVRGTIWSSLVADFLLAKILKLEKYQNVVCICLDRQGIDILSTVSVSDRDRVTIVNDCYSESCSDMLKGWNEVVNANNCQENGNKSTAVLLFSISELVLRHDLNSAIHIIREISKWNLGAFVTCMHSTLHSLKDRTRIEDAFTSVLYVNPNDGSFSEEVHAEVQTVKKSVNTGKVTEAMELFGLSAGAGTGGIVDVDGGACARLVCIHRKKVTCETPNEPDASSKPADPSAAAAATAAAAAVQIHQATQGSKRLVTFDSADPEFDEDSDPDADLDL